MKQPLVLGIAGGTGSGKSAITRSLVEIYGESLCILHHDDYYKPFDHLSTEKRKLVNFDHPDSLDTALLISQIKDLKEGKAIECPTYDFTKFIRCKETKHIDPSPIIVVDGILIFAIEELRSLMDIKIFVDTDADVRLARRIRRDIRDRGRNLNAILTQYIKSVKPMHERFVEPSKQFADVIVPNGRNFPIIDLLKARIDEYLSDDGEETRIILQEEEEE